MYFSTYHTIGFFMYYRFFMKKYQNGEEIDAEKYQIGEEKYQIGEEIALGS